MKSSIEVTVSIEKEGKKLTITWPSMSPSMEYGTGDIHVDLKEIIDKDLSVRDWARRTGMTFEDLGQDLEEMCDNADNDDFIRSL